MKKNVIRLTESDMVRLVKRVVNEQEKRYKVINTFNAFLDSQFEPHSEDSNVDDFDGRNEMSTITWHKDGKEIVVIENLEYFYIANHIWDRIKERFQMSDADMKHWIEDWVASHYGLEGVLPLPRRERFIKNIDDTRYH